MGNSQRPAVVDPAAFLQVREGENELIPTATLKPSIHLRKETLSISPSGYLSFTYDAYSDIVLNFYYFAMESLKAFGNTECYYIDLEKYPNPSDHKLSGGLNNQFPDSLIHIDLSNFTYPEISFADKKLYPLIIEMRPQDNHNLIETTYCKFALEESNLIIKPIRQKLTMNEKSYELNDIYGIRPGHEEDCVVCLTNPINTIVLPCRHYCLCLDCANIVRGQNNSKCPICRIRVETLLNIKIDN